MIKVELWLTECGKACHIPDDEETYEVGREGFKFSRSLCGLNIEAHKGSAISKDNILWCRNCKRINAPVA